MDVFRCLVNFEQRDHVWVLQFAHQLYLSEALSLEIVSTLWFHLLYSI